MEVVEATQDMLQLRYLLTVTLNLWWLPALAGRMTRTITAMATVAGTGTSPTRLPGQWRFR
jgi:hypothetical protein